MLTVELVIVRAAVWPRENDSLVREPGERARCRGVRDSCASRELAPARGDAHGQRVQRAKDAEMAACDKDVVKRCCQAHGR